MERIGGEGVIVNVGKLFESMARACINSSSLCEKAHISRNTFKSMIQGGKVRPATIGRIAKALGVDVKDILEEA